MPLKEYYVPAWTNHNYHLGVGSTSTVEGAHDMVKLWLQTSTGTLLEVVRALHMEFRKQFIELINRIPKEMSFHVKNFPPHICSLNGKVSHYALQIAFDNFKTKFLPNEKFTNKYNNYQGIPCKHKTQKAFAKCQRLEISDFHPQWYSNLRIPGSEDLPKFILKYTLKAINVQGDGNCGYRTVSNYIYKTQDQWADVRGDFAEEIQQNQDLYEAMNTFIPSVSSYLDRIEWYEDIGKDPKRKWISTPDMGDPIANKYKRPVFFYSTVQSFPFSLISVLQMIFPPFSSASWIAVLIFPLDIIISKVYPVPHYCELGDSCPTTSPGVG
ncbi:hypothetical protein O181_000438 [Austropuccinia psidii MF-1]|uniref:OTU domain-containing protein n=1 Tax=Austropuccinia psidii MF-1 TaxID=1389203 RepID=A0A9Q3B8U5_9BASI|nr:hypothetical protein [Austropuccinia psidii MF-1]